MSSAACDNSAPCPPNFIAHTLTADLTLTVSQCSDALIGSAALVTQVMEFTFINADDDILANCEDRSGTAFGTTQNLIVATAALAETHVSKWETLSGSSGTCPR
ncbi:unnamed protein product, partial [Polarella glacialis]